jgi:hypothetical protein
MEQQTVAPQTGQSLVDGLGTDAEVAGDLTVGHPSDGLQDEAAIQTGKLLPVRRRKRLPTKVTAAVPALVTLYTVGRLLSKEKTRSFESPSTY